MIFYFFYDSQLHGFEQDIDCVSPIGTLIANVAIFDEVSALTSTERWLMVCLFVCLLGSWLHSQTPHPPPKGCLKQSL